VGEDKRNKGNSKKSSTSAIIVCIVLIIAILVCGVILFKLLFGGNEAEPEQTTQVEEATDTDSTEQSLEDEMAAFEPAEDETYVDELLGIDIPEKDIDWDDLWAQNDDVYAWIYIPNTAVDYPVLQHDTEDNYYLDHNIDDSYGYPGCVYSQLCNSKDFSDPVTLLYAHDMKNGTYFHTLHFFEDEEFFNDNQYIFIYTPETTLVYQIFATKIFNDSLIPMAYDFSYDTEIDAYITDLMTAQYSDDYVREGVSVTNDSHILTLSTCIGSMPNNRWLVNGVLLNNSEVEQ
jgi:sortase B